MKTLLFLVGFCALALAVPMPSTTKFIPKKYHMDDKVFMERQYHIFRLFKYVTQPTQFKEYVEMANTFIPMKHLDMYTQPQYVKEFFYYYEHDIVPRGVPFSIFYPEHLKPTIALFKMFYYAKDFDTFFKTAVWARQHVNEGMWLYTFSVALVHREDTFGIVPPAIYEIFPFYFFNSEVIHEAQQYKMMFDGKYPKMDDWEGYTIVSNYSGWYMNLHPEQYLSYFMEDIGLTSFYFYYHIHYPFWMDGDEFGLKNDRRGEMFIFMHQQLLARYYLERLSNEFGEIEELDFTSPIETGYYPSLQYPNGMEFPSRPNRVHVGKRFEYNHPHMNFTDAYSNVMDYRRRMKDAVDMGFAYGPDGNKVYLSDMEVFGNMLEGTPDSPNLGFYGNLPVYARHILGYTPHPLNNYKVVPSALEHVSTDLRDPVFWQFYKWLMNFVFEYRNNLPPYTKHDLDFDGVDIESFEIDRLTTYFEDFYSHIGGAVFYKENELTKEPFKIRVKQRRLNHKPYTYKITVNSKKDVDAIAKVFIGPKYDEYGRPIDLNQNRMNFFMIDKFMYKLKTGKNLITRHCTDYSFFVGDRTMLIDMYKQIMGAVKGDQQFTIDGSEAYFGFPRRLALPKGQPGGITYQMFVIFYPYHKMEGELTKTAENMYPMVGTGGFTMGDKPYGYPFEKMVDYYSFDVTNAMFKDVVIYHKNHHD